MSDTKPEPTRHDFADGKYTVIYDHGKMQALRYGEPWQRDITGDNLIYWMLVEVDRLKSELSKFDTRDMEIIQTQADAWFAVCDELKRSVPDWGDNGGTGVQAAVTTISKLAATESKVGEAAKKAGLTLVRTSAGYKFSELIAATAQGPTT